MTKTGGNAYLSYFYMHTLPALLLISFLSILLFFSLYNVSIVNSISFFIVCIIFLFIPGYVLLKLTRVRIDDLPLVVVSVAIGMAISPMLYYFSGIILNHYLYLLVVFTALIYGSYVIHHDGDLSNLTAKGKKYNVLYILIPFAIIFLFLHLSHFTDVHFMNNGNVFFRSHYTTESVFHLGIINRAMATLPPTYPYASGYSMPYHIDMHIIGVILSKYGFIDTIKTTFIYLPYLLFFLLFAIAALFLKTMKHTGVVICIAFGLFLFASDLGFIPGVLMDSLNGKPWTLVFKSTIWGLFTLNGIIPAVIMLFTFLVILKKYLKEKNYTLLILLAIIVYASFRMKSSMGPQIAACGAAVSIFMMFGNDRRLWSGLLLSMLAAGFFMSADLLLKPGFTENVSVLLLQPLNGMSHTASQLGVTAFINAVKQPLSHPVIFILFFVVYIIGFMGIRLLLFKYLADFFKTSLKHDGVFNFILLFSISGLILSEFIYLGDSSGNINNAAWFAGQSLFLAMYFPFLFLSRLDSTRIRIVLVVVFIFLSFPTTFQFLNLRYNDSYVKVTSGELQAVGYIKQKTSPDDVIWELPERYRPSLSAHLAGRETVFSMYMTFINSTVSKERIRERVRDIQTFYQVNTSVEERRNIIQLYNVSVVLAKKENRSFYDALGFLREMYSNNECVVYSVY